MGFHKRQTDVPVRVKLWSDIFPELPASAYTLQDFPRTDGYGSGRAFGNVCALIRCTPSMRCGGSELDLHRSFVCECFLFCCSRERTRPTAIIREYPLVYISTIYWYISNSTPAATQNTHYQYYNSMGVFSGSLAKLGGVGVG